MTQTLVLEVVGSKAAQFGGNSRKSFPATGGSIGRADDCDWVLGASGVSRVHAMIRHLNGIYFIEDRSTNGILLNGAPIKKGEPAALSSGDHFLIDTFEVDVQLQDTAAGPGGADQPSALPPGADKLPPMDDLLDFGSPGKPSRAEPPGPHNTDDLLAGTGRGTSAADVDPLQILGGAGPELPDDDLLGAEQLQQAPESASHFRPPSTAGQNSGHILPEDWDITTDEFAPAGDTPEIPAPQSAPPPPVAPAPTATPSPPASGAVASSLPADLEPILRIVVDGVMEALRARAEIKNTFRLPVTIIQRSENNPLKFAPTPEDALQKILAPTGSAFLSGAEAFEDAFDDIRHHQMAMLAGVRAAFESMLAHFHPDRVQQDVDGKGAKRGGLMDFSGKGGKYWEKYREQYEALSSNPDDCFRRLFGDEFARAYEDQLAKLRASRKRPRPSGSAG